MEKYNFSDEVTAWNEFQEIRNSFSPSLYDSIRANSRGEAIERAIDVTKSVLEDFAKVYDFTNIEPGHGPGHLMRDYMNSLILFGELEGVNPKHIFPGFVGGALHDIGCAVIPRYEESTRALRHAEAGSLLVKKLLDKNPDLNDAERISIAYSMAAHTHYTKENVVECIDGKKRTIKPYLDSDGDIPLWPVLFTRWVDRLDCNGPTFVGRHYLTQAEEHKDFDGVAHFDVKFGHHMNPLLRAFKEQVDNSGNRNQTMSEHMKMFGDSQNNDSIYGKHDFGFMVKLRDRQTERVYRIVESTQSKINFSVEREIQIRDAWTSYLANNVEHSQLGEETAKTLDEMFGELEKGTRNAWCNAFLTTMQEYVGYSRERLHMLEGISEDKLKLPGIADDIRKTITPGKNWVSVL